MADAGSHRSAAVTGAAPEARPPTAPAPDAPAPGLAQRALPPRLLGFALGAVALGGPLVEQGAAPGILAVLAAGALSWPFIARAIALNSPSTGRAELRNLALDSALTAAWLPVIGFEPLPTLAILAMLSANNLGVGGARLVARGLLAQAVGILVGLGLSGWHPAPTLSWLTFATSAPFLVVYPMLLAHLHHGLQRRLAQRKRDLERGERLHRETLDALQAGVVLWDRDDRLVLCNAEFRRLYARLEPLLTPGRSFADLCRAAVDNGLVPEAVGRENRWLAERISQHGRNEEPRDRQMSNGTWVRVFEKHLPDGATLAIALDVTAMIRAGEDLAAARAEAERARDRLQDAIEALPDAFALFDAQDRLQVWNQSYLAWYDRSTTRARRGATFETLLREGLAVGQYPEAVGREEAWLADRLAQHREPRGAVLQELPGNRWMRINERRTREGGYAGVRTDVTDLVHREQELRRLIAERDTYEAGLREANEQLETLSTTDPLTGLGNRRLFDRRLAEEWQRARRHGAPLALLLVDVDHFKAYNDFYGHPAGDKCLRLVADRLRATAQRSGDLVARYGGEEFALLLPHTTPAQAQAAAERCVAEVSAAAILHARSPLCSHVTVSVGFAVAVLDPRAATEGTQEDLAAFVQRADAALYEVKRTGRNRAVSG